MPGADSDELAPATCDACNRLVFSGTPTRLVRASGYVDSTLCTACATKVRAVLLDLDKIIIVVDPKLLKGYTEQVLRALQKVVARQLYVGGAGRQYATNSKSLTISITEGSQPGDMLITPGNGVVYRWSDIRDDLEALGG